MKQFVLPASYRGGPASVTLGAADAHRLLRVLRLREGDRLPAVDPSGGRYTMTILRAGRGRCEVAVQPEEPGGAGAGAGPSPRGDARGPAPAVDAPFVTLLQCLPKGRKIDLIVRQATEAGVARIVPVVSARTVVRPGDDDARLGRLERVAREAVQQSGAARMPLIEEPRDLAALVGSGEDWGVALVFHEAAPDGEGAPRASAPLHRLLAGRPRTVSILIGPEGGLADSEVALLAGAGFAVVHLDTGVLRVETAAIYALGAVMSILRERDEWKPVRA